MKRSELKQIIKEMVNEQPSLQNAKKEIELMVNDNDELSSIEKKQLIQKLFSKLEKDPKGVSMGKFYDWYEDELNKKPQNETQSKFNSSSIYNVVTKLILDYIDNDGKNLLYILNEVKRAINDIKHDYSDSETKLLGKVWSK